MKKLMLILVFLLILIPIAYSKKVNFLNVEIDSTDTFYCKPIYKGDKCLVEATIKIKNSNIIKINPLIKIDFSIPVDDYQLIFNNLKYSTTLNKKSFLSNQMVMMGKDNDLKLRFFTNQNGQFNITLKLYNNLNYLGDLILDPHINISINSSYPSYHLINGLNDIYRNDEFGITNEISGELSDSSNLTSFDTIVNHIHKGDIRQSILDTLIISTGDDIKTVRVYDDIYLITFVDESFNGYIKTVQILDDGIINTTIDELVFSPAPDVADSPDLVKVTDFSDYNIFAIVYTGKIDDGFISTFNVSNTGIIVAELEDSLEWNTDDVFNSKIIKIDTSDTNVMIIAYSDVNYYGSLTNVNISNEGLVTVSTSTSLFEPYANTEELEIVNTSYDNTFLIAYSDQYNSGKVETMNISDSGKPETISLDSLNFSKIAYNPEIIHVDNDVYVISYEGEDDDGFITTINVNKTSLGSGISKIDDFEFDIDNVGVTEIIKIANDTYAVTYDNNLGVNIETFEIFDTGEIIKTIDNYNFNSSGLRPYIMNIYDEIFSIAYYESDTTNGIIQTFNISKSNRFYDKSLSVYFNHSFNESLFYWIEFIIPNSISENVTIYSYVNTTGINKTNRVSQIVVDDITKINIGDLIYTGYDFPFRLFTQTNVNISEVYLIEEIECSPNLTESYTIGSCLINDTYRNTTSYFDENDCTTKEDTTAEYSCNYCSEDINLYSTVIGGCNAVTLTENISYFYQDDNYNVCCDITGISSDCNIQNATLYPNSTVLEDCSSISCLYDTTPYLKFFDKRIPILCQVNENASYDFLTYVKADHKIIQTNPNRILIDHYGEYNSFKSEDGLVNLYYTSENLRPDRTITIIVEGEEGKFLIEFNVTPSYKNPYQIQDRAFWIRKNTTAIILVMFLSILIGIALFFLTKKIVRESRLR